MKLSDYFQRPIRDKKFERLGYLSSAQGPNILSHLSDERFLPELFQNKRNISCVVTTSQIAYILKDQIDIGIAAVKDPTLSFYELHNKLVSDEKAKKSRHRKTVIKSKRIHKSAFVSPLDVTIEKNVVVEPRAIILPGVTIGNGSIVRAGAVIGSEGFENKRTLTGLIHVEHAGKVSLGENVDIGANTCVCKGLFPYDTTTVGSNTKIDQLVHIAHNVQVGKNCMIVASALVGGSTIIEDDCWIGPSAVVTNNVVVGAKAFVTLGSVVTKDVMPGQKVSGVWAINHDRFVRLMKGYES